MFQIHEQLIKELRGLNENISKGKLTKTQKRKKGEKIVINIKTKFNMCLVIQAF